MNKFIIAEDLLKTVVKIINVAAHPTTQHETINKVLLALTNLSQQIVPKIDQKKNKK